MANITQQDLLTLYLSAAQAYAKSHGLTIDVSQFSDFQNKGAAIAGIGAGIIQDTTTLFNNVWPQFANEQGINLGLASAGIPAIYPATPSIMKLSGLNLGTDKSYVIPVGTILTAPNGATYAVISTSNNLIEVTITSDAPDFYVASTNKGLNTNQTNSTILTIVPPIISTDNSTTLNSASVTSSVDGVDRENLGNAANRLIEIKQTPLCSDRATDFKYLAIDPINNVTDAIVLINNQLEYTTPGNINVAIFDVSGNPITNSILNKGLIPGTTAEVFTRTSSNDSISVTQAVMNNQDIIGAFPHVNTVTTQPLTTTDTHPFFQIKVTLQPGYSLNTKIMIDDTILTLSQLIQRETRRAICAQPYGAVLTKDNVTSKYLTSSIAVSSIEQQLDSSLGTPSTIGGIGNFLSNRTVLTYDTGTSSYIYKSSIPLALGIPEDLGNPLEWIYDISLTPSEIYTNIDVELSS